MYCSMVQPALTAVVLVAILASALQADPIPLAEWSTWGRWSTCSASCGGGSIHRIRSCSGEGCIGDDTEGKDCNTLACVVEDVPDGCVDQDIVTYYGEDYTCAEMLDKKGSYYCKAGHWFDMANKCCETCRKLDMTGECKYGDLSTIVRLGTATTCRKQLALGGDRYCAPDHYFEMTKKCCGTCQGVDLTVQCPIGSEPATVIKNGEEITCADLLTLKGPRYCAKGHYFRMAWKCCETCAEHTTH